MKTLELTHRKQITVVGQYFTVRADELSVVVKHDQFGRVHIQRTREGLTVEIEGVPGETFLERTACAPVEFDTPGVTFKIREYSRVALNELGDPTLYQRVQQWLNRRVK